MNVRLAPQVVARVRRLPPETRKCIRRALRNLARGKGDIKQLEGPLAEYCRLRIGSHRIIFRHGKSDNVDCIFAEQRSIVYEVFAEALRRHLAGDD